MIDEKPTERSDRPSEPKPDFDFSDWKRLPPLASSKRRQGQRMPSTKVSVVERVCAAFLLALVSPLMAVIALIVKSGAPKAPVFYSQERVGIDRRRRARAGDETFSGDERRAQPGVGRLFDIYKFRTMVPNAEQLSGPVWASDNDPRITRTGRVLRYLRLDELPQLINVVRGEMRLIGPRPERPFFVTQLASSIPEYTDRLLVHPGITGLAQVEREYDSTVDHVKTKVKYDLYYARNRSPLLDFKIILKTLDVVIRGKGAK